MRTPAIGISPDYRGSKGARLLMCVVPEQPAWHLGEHPDGAPFSKGARSPLSRSRAAMSTSSRTRANDAVLMLASVAALSLALAASGAAFANPQQYTIVPSSVEDDGLLISGSPVVLTDRSDRATNKAWMDFETDPCGTLLQVENGRSIMVQSSFFDDLDDFDDEDPSDLGREMIGRWLSEHPEIAVINDGVDKGCEGGWYDDEERPGDFEARHLLQDHTSELGRLDALQIA
jgi:hypothetical protein